MILRVLVGFESRHMPVTKLDARMKTVLFWLTSFIEEKKNNTPIITDKPDQINQSAQVKFSFFN